MHPFGATMKTLGRATAHRGLFGAVTIQPRHDGVGDLFD
jgi:hypothetical protein